LKGLHVYPGMINSATKVGLAEISSIRETMDTSEIGEFNPQLRALVAVNPESEHIPVTRAGGITSVITMPEGPMIGGQAAMIRLDGWTWEEMSVVRSAAMVLRFPALGGSGGRGGGGGGRGFGGAGGSFAEQQRRHHEQIAKLRDYFEQARRYQKARAAAGPGFQRDLKLEAMQPVIEGKLPVLVTAVRERAIREAIDFAEKERIRIILAQVRRPGKMLAEIKNKSIPVIVGETLALPMEEDDAYDAPFTLPFEMHKAGVKFAFGTFDVQFARNVPFQAAAAVGFGLPQEAALRALTLGAAEIWGVADRIGSIDKGKQADLIVTDGDPLEAKTNIKQVFIGGRNVPVDTKHTDLYQKYLNRP
ncbi:MAG: amidohydrolase family protein, partial [Bryobacteraceae bacterium]